MKISVIVPCLFRKPFNDNYCVEEALTSILTQRRSYDTLREMEIIVGIDPKVRIPKSFRWSRATFVHSTSTRCGTKLNDAIAASTGDILAFCADDDMWRPEFLDTALPYLEQAEFVSTNTLQMDGQGNILRISDFPNQSGWIMKREVYDRVGPFNDDLYYANDNEWLGRLGEVGKSRVHLVEATAPLIPALMKQVRPWIWNVLDCGRPIPTIIRHGNYSPLVIDRVHPNAVMQKIERIEWDRREYDRINQYLINRFGRIPW